MKSTFKPLVRPADAPKPPVKAKTGQGVSPEILFDELLSALARGKMLDQPQAQGDRLVEESVALAAPKAQAPMLAAADQLAPRAAMEHLAITADPAGPRPDLAGLARVATAATAIASNQPSPYQDALAPGMEPGTVSAKSQGAQETGHVARLASPATPAPANSGSAQPRTPVALEPATSDSSQDELPCSDPGAPPAGSEAHLGPHAVPPAETPTKTTLDAVPVPVATHLLEMPESMAHEATLLAVRPGAPEHSSVHIVHPDLGAVSLEVHTQQGCLEVTAVLQTEAAAKLIQANEQGLRHGAQRGGLSFSGLKVRVQGDESGENRTAGAKSRHERGKKN